MQQKKHHKNDTRREDKDKNQNNTDITSISTGKNTKYGGNKRKTTAPNPKYQQWQQRKQTDQEEFSKVNNKQKLETCLYFKLFIASIRPHQQNTRILREQIWKNDLTMKTGDHNQKEKLTLKQTRRVRWSGVQLPEPPTNQKTQKTNDGNEQVITIQQTQLSGLRLRTLLNRWIQTLLPKEHEGKHSKFKAVGRPIRTSKP